MRYHDILAQTETNAVTCGSTFTRFKAAQQSVSATVASSGSAWTDTDFSRTVALDTID